MARRSWGLGRSSLVSGPGDAEHEDAASSPGPSPIHRAGGLEPEGRPSTTSSTNGWPPARDAPRTTLLCGPAGHGLR
jgi:hypothetical protein